MARKLSMKMAINEALDQEMTRDPSVIVLGEDIVGGAGADGEKDAWGGVLGVTKGLYAKHGDRLLDTPLSESAYVGAAIGAAACGMRPGGGADVHRLHGRVLRPDLQPGRQVPLHVRRQGGDAGRDPRDGRRGLSRGGAAQPDADAAVHAYSGPQGRLPVDAYDTKGLLIQAIRDNDPVIFCEHKNLYGFEGEVPENSYAIPFGEANIVRDGKDVSIVTYGLMVHRALEAAATLAKEGIEAEVVDLRTLSPLDIDTVLESVENTGRLVVRR